MPLQTHVVFDDENVDSMLTWQRCSLLREAVSQQRQHRCVGDVRVHGEPPGHDPGEAQVPVEIPQLDRLLRDMWWW